MISLKESQVFRLWCYGCGSIYDGRISTILCEIRRNRITSISTFQGFASDRTATRLLRVDISSNLRNKDVACG